MVRMRNMQVNYQGQKNGGYHSKEKIMDPNPKYKNKYRGEMIIQWLSDHPLLSRHALCTVIGYDASNLQKAFDASRPIPAKYLDAFESELKKYGFTPPS